MKRSTALCWQTLVRFLGAFDHDIFDRDVVNAIVVVERGPRYCKPKLDHVEFVPKWAHYRSGLPIQPTL
jgi:hypothetical protein